MEELLEEGYKYIFTRRLQIVVNIFYNDKQKLALDEVWKHPVKCF